MSKFKDYKRTDVELSGSDVVFTTVQNGTFGKASYGMFSSPICNCMDPRNTSWDRPIVDDATSTYRWARKIIFL